MNKEKLLKLISENRKKIDEHMGKIKKSLKNYDRTWLDLDEYSNQIKYELMYIQRLIDVEKENE